MEQNKRGGARLGSGRKPKPATERLIPKTIRLSLDQITFCAQQGDLSKYIRALIDFQRR